MTYLITCHQTALEKRNWKRAFPPMFTETLPKKKKNSVPPTRVWNPPQILHFILLRNVISQNSLSQPEAHCQIPGYLMQKTQRIQVFLGAFSSKEQILHTGMNRLQITQAARLTSSANNARRGSSSQWAIIHRKTLTILRVSKVLDWSELIKPHKPPKRKKEGRGKKKEEGEWW